MIRRTLIVQNRLGLHARAAAKLVRLASGFRSRIYLARDGSNDAAEAGSILGILMLSASQGTRLVVSIEGRDEVEAGEAIRRLFNAKFGEEG